MHQAGAKIREFNGAHAWLFSSDHLGSNKPTVLINCGWASAPTLYSSLASRLTAQGHDVLVMSMRGVERSLNGSTVSVYTEHNARDTLSILRNFGFNDLILMPHSCGAQVALCLYSIMKAEAPEITVRKVVFNAPSVPDNISALPRESFITRNLSRVAAGFLNAISGSMPKGAPTLKSRALAKIAAYAFRIANFFLMFRGDQLSREVHRSFWKEASALPGEVLALSATAFVRNREAALYDLHNLNPDCPVRVVTYRNDYLVSPLVSSEIYDGVYRSRHKTLEVVVFESGGHFGHESPHNNLIL